MSTTGVAAAVVVSAPARAAAVMARSCPALT
jgi:hypothetical protein